MTKKDKDTDFVAINIEDGLQAVGVSVAGAIVHTAQVTDVPGETVAALPQEQVMQAIATAVTLTEDDVPEAKVGLNSPLSLSVLSECLMLFCSEGDRSRGNAFG